MNIKKIFNFVFGMSIFTSTLFLILGLSLFIKPELTISIISGIIGIIIILSGINSIVSYFNGNNQNLFNKVQLVFGILSSLAGVVLIFNPTAVVSLFPLILGIYFVITGISKIQYSLDMKNYNTDKWYILLIMAFLMIIVGFFLMFNPFEGVVLITQMIGAIISIYAIIDIINYIVLRNDIKRVSEIIKENSSVKNSNKKVIDMK